MSSPDAYLWPDRFDDFKGGIDDVQLLRDSLAHHLQFAITGRAAGSFARLTPYWLKQSQEQPRVVPQIYVQALVRRDGLCRR